MTALAELLDPATAWQLEQLRAELRQAERERLHAPGRRARHAPAAVFRAAEHPKS